LLFVFTEKLAVEAMFQGTQYLTYDLTTRSDPIYSSTDKLSLYLKTTEPDGLIFYTGKSPIFSLSFLQGTQMKMITTSTVYL